MRIFIINRINYDFVIFNYRANLEGTLAWKMNVLLIFRGLILMRWSHQTLSLFEQAGVSEIHAAFLASLTAAARSRT